MTKTKHVARGNVTSRLSTKGCVWRRISAIYCYRQHKSKLQLNHPHTISLFLHCAPPLPDFYTPKLVTVYCLQSELSVRLSHAYAGQCHTWKETETACRKECGLTVGLKVPNLNRNPFYGYRQKGGAYMNLKAVIYWRCMQHTSDARRVPWMDAHTAPTKVKYHEPLHIFLGHSVLLHPNGSQFPCQFSYRFLTEGAGFSPHSLLSSGYRGLFPRRQSFYFKKAQSKVHPKTYHEGPEGGRGIALLFL